MITLIMKIKEQGPRVMVSVQADQDKQTEHETKMAMTILLRISHGSREFGILTIDQKGANEKGTSEGGAPGEDPDSLLRHPRRN